MDVRRNGGRGYGPAWHPCLADAACRATSDGRREAAHPHPFRSTPHSAPLGTVNPYSPGYSAVNRALAAGRDSSVDLTAVGPALSVVGTHEALERRQLER